MNNDYQSCIKHGKKLLRDFGKRITSKTRYTINQYMAEAYCMSGQTGKSLQLMEDNQEVLDNESMIAVESLANFNHQI
jgi:hypothetical protein